MRNSNTPFCIYLYIQKKFLEHSQNGILQKSYAMSFLHHYRIPSTLWPAVIKEMENIGLVEKVNRHTIKVINAKRNRLIELPAELNNRVGLY